MLTVSLTAAVIDERTERAESMMLRDEPDSDVGIYLDSSGLAKIYVAEHESDALESFIRCRQATSGGVFVVVKYCSRASSRAGGHNARS